MEASEIATPILNTYQALVSAFGEFLTVAAHTVLYERNIYPRTSFLNARKYNLAVRQNRHPRVCKWISDAVAAVEAELLKGTVSQTSLIIYSPATNIPLERFVFSTASFPLVPIADVLTPFEVTADPAPGHDASSPSPASSPAHSPPASPSRAPHTAAGTPLIDLTAQFPAVLSRLCTLSGTLKPLPRNCTFTFAIELRDQPVGEAPIGWPMPWVPAEPGLQSKGGGKAADGRPQAEAEAEADAVSKKTVAGPGEDGSGEAEVRRDGGKGQKRTERVSRGQYLGGVRTTPVRSVEAGPFLMEVWVEEGKDKVGMDGAGGVSQSSREGETQHFGQTGEQVHIAK